MPELHVNSMQTLVQGTSIVKLKVLSVQFHRNKLLLWMLSRESGCEFLRPQLEKHLWGRFEVRIGPREKFSENLSRNFVLMVNHSAT